MINITQEHLDTIEIIVNKLARKFKFGYHEIEDMKQQARLFAIEGIEKWDQNRPLENFLWTHVRNRLHNFKRDNYSRPDKPCLSCPLYDAVNDACTKFNDNMECDLWAGWMNRNNAKRGLMSNSTPIEGADAYEFHSNVGANLDFKNLFEQVDSKIPIDLREDWLRLVYELRIPKNRKLRLLEIIQYILEEDDADTEEERGAIH